MTKAIKAIIFLLFALIVSGKVFASEIAVKIKPAEKITTSNVDLQEGDSLKFVVAEDVVVNSKPYLKKGQAVTATLTSIEDNNYLAQPAKIYIENFRTVSADKNPVKLKGIVYKKGNDHHVLGEFVVFEMMRGGEVQIKPEKDVFTIYLEENL